MTMTTTTTTQTTIFCVHLILFWHSNPNGRNNTNSNYYQIKAWLSEMPLLLHRFSFQNRIKKNVNIHWRDESLSQSFLRRSESVSVIYISIIIHIDRKELLTFGAATYSWAFETSKMSKCFNLLKWPKNTEKKIFETWNAAKIQGNVRQFILFH